MDLDLEELFAQMTLATVAPPTVRKSLRSLLRFAVSGDIAAIKDLVEKFKEKGEGFVEKALGVRNAVGMSPLHFAAAGGSIIVCQYLLETGKVDINLKDIMAGETPLHHAISRDRSRVAVFLLKNGADPNMENKKKRTALHYAIEYGGSKQLVQLLISKGADVNAMADLGTPLHFAAQRGKVELVNLLLKNHANPNVITRDLLSPLLASIHGQSLECMELMIKAGADPNFTGSIGLSLSPLVFAVVKGSKEIIRCLIKAGASPNAVDIQGMTPIEVAALSNKRGVVRILFPQTSPIPTIPQWTISGLFQRVHSDNAGVEREQKLMEIVVGSKPKGDECFYQKDYFGAIQWYTQGITFNPNDASVLSQRSRCWAKLNAGGLALEDAEACIRVRPNWEAYYLAGSARMLLKEYKMAACAFSNGLKLDPGNAVLERSFREATEAHQNSNYFEI